MDLAITKAQAKLIAFRQSAIARAQGEFEAAQKLLERERLAQNEVLAQIMTDGGVPEGAAIERWEVVPENGKPILRLVETPKPTTAVAG